MLYFYITENRKVKYVRKNADSLKHVSIGISSKKIIAFINRTKTIGYVRGFYDKK